MEKPVPEVGKFYHFWDDGKTSLGRHYICKCERVLRIKDAKKITVDVPHWDFNHNREYIETLSLYDHWYDEERPNHPWLYAEETDYFVECSCPKYDTHNLWFVRTKHDGGWFSMNIQSSWQGGELDVDGSIYESIIEECKSWKEGWELIEAYEAETYENKSAE